MKKAGFISLVFVWLLTAIQPVAVSGQEEDGNKVVTIERDLPPFTGVEVGGTFHVYLTQGSKQSVKIETNEKYLDKVRTKVMHETLKITSGSIKSPSRLNIYIEAEKIDHLEVSGAAELESKNVLSGDRFELRASGACNIRLDLDVDELDSDISGAASVRLSGSAEEHNLYVSGGANMKAYDLATQNTDASVSGAGNARVNAEKNLVAETHGAGSLKYSEEPENKKITKDGSSNVFNYKGSEYGYKDSTKVKIGNLNIDVYEQDDEVRVKIGNHEVFVDEDGDVSVNKHRRKKKFNGHWAGFELGVNGYVNEDFNANFPKKYEYLDQRMEKSIAVNLNFFEQNFAFTRNQKFGLVTGLGTSWNNYRFLRNTRLTTDSSFLTGYIEKGVDLRKSKLTIWYVNVPLLLEFQTNSYHKKNSFHIAAGMVMNFRLSSHTKKYYDEKNKDYEVTWYNPYTEAYEVLGASTSPDRSKSKNHDDFFLAPFKWDATVRIGWGFVNLFGTYSLNTLFREDKGPEVYPWSLGITLTNL